MRTFVTPRRMAGAAWMQLGVVLAAALGMGCGGRVIGEGLPEKAGACAAPAACGTACFWGLAPCGDRCVDLAHDVANCGACGTACALGETCADGHCAPVCPAGSTACGTACVDTGADPANCGGCGVACGTGAPFCSQGTCAASCPAGLTPCAGICVDLGSSAANCGACGAACNGGHPCVSSSCNAVESAWAMVGHDERHTGENPLETGKPPLTLAWATNVGALPLTSVAIESGRVFVTSESTDFKTTPLRALNLANGVELWNHDFGTVFSVGQPTARGGAVFIQHCNNDENTKLWKLDAATGDVEWTAPLQAQWDHYWSPLVVDDRVFVDAGFYGGLYGFSTTIGKKIFFTNKLEHYDGWAPAYSGGQVFTFVTGHLRAHDPKTGKVQWTTPVTWTPIETYSLETAPVLGDGKAFVIAPPTLSSIDLTTQAIAWSADGSYTGMAAYAGGVVYALNGGSLMALDASTGHLQWAFAGDAALQFPPVIAAGHVYVASANNTYAVDAATGAQVWTDGLGGWLAVASGKLLVARTNGELAAYNLTQP